MLAKNWTFWSGLNIGDDISSSTNMYEIDSGWGDILYGYWPDYGEYGHWTNTQNDKYLGFKFKIGSDYHYAWVHLTTNVYAIDNMDFTIKGYAYNSVPNEAIFAGETDEPYITSFLPEQAEIYVEYTATVSAIFNEDVTVVDLSGIEIRDTDEALLTGVSAILEADNRTITISHDDFVENTTYTVFIPENSVLSLGSGNTNNETSWSFTTIPLVPYCVTNPLPLSGEDNVSINPTLSWDASYNATGYEVWFGETEAMVHIEDVTVLTYSPSDLNNNTEYKWQILAKNSNGTADACETWSFTTVSLTPDCAINPIPAIATDNVSINPTLEWEVVDNATSYKIWFGEAGSMEYVDEVLTTIYSPQELNYNTQYEWQIQPVNGSGVTTDCDIWSFITEDNVDVSKQNSNIEIYPNPTNGKFTIKNKQFENAIITLSDITGKIVEQLLSDSEHVSVDISNNPSGIYFVEIKTDTEIFTSKIIKK